MTFAAAALLLVLSPAIGSFLGVLVDRLPRGEDTVFAPSRCRSCNARIGARDLVPLVSYPLLKGQCRACGAAVPQWLWLMEIASLGLGGLALLQGGTVPDVWSAALLLWLLLALAVCDLLWMRLPDLLTFLLALLCVFAAAMQGMFLLALSGALLGAGSFLALRIGYRALRGQEGLGLGDVKLMVGLGALVGPFDLPLLVLIAALSALGAALVVRRRPAADMALPFGTALCFAAGLLWLVEKTLF